MASAKDLIMAPTSVVRSMGVEEAIEEGVRETAAKAADIWQRKLQGGTQTGSVYTQALRTLTQSGKTVVAPVGPLSEIEPGGPGVRRASAPGEPPAPVTGGLATSISFGRMPGESDKWRVFSTAPHAPMMELGVGSTRPIGPHPAGISIAPRPSLGPTLQEISEEGADAFEAHVQAMVGRMQFGRVAAREMRGKMYDLSSALGDLQSLGIAPNKIYGVRGTALTAAKMLGDFEALDSGRLGKRMMRRAAGRGLGQLQGSLVPQGGGRFARRIARHASGRVSNRMLQRMP